MKQAVKIAICLGLFYAQLCQSQDTALNKTNKHEIGLDFFMLACGDSIGDYYLKTTNFKNVGDEQWAASSFGFSLAYFYTYKVFLVGIRSGIMKNQEIYNTWADSKPTTASISKRNILIKHTKFFISPTIKLEKKIKWLTTGLSIEIPLMFNDKIKTEMDYSYANYNNNTKDTLLASGIEHWEEIVKSGVSMGAGFGAYASLLLTKKIKLEFSLNEYYFIINTNQEIERAGLYQGNNLQTLVYSNYSGIIDQKKELRIRSCKFSKLSLKLNFAFIF